MVSQAIREFVQRTRSALLWLELSTKALFIIYLTVVIAVSLIHYLFPLSDDYNAHGHLLVSVLALVLLFGWMQKPALYAFSGHLIASAVALLLVYMTSRTGGIQSAAMVWLAVLALPTLMLQGRNPALLWIGISELLFVVLFFASEYGDIAPAQPISGRAVSWTVLNHVMVMGSMALAIWVYEKLYEQEQHLIDDRNAQLRQLHAALVETQAHRDEFVAAVGHELRTPMNAILGFNTVLQRELADSPQQLEHVEYIRRSTERLLQVVNDILAFSQMQAGRLRLHPVDFDLHLMLRETLETFVPRANANGLQCELECLPGLPRRVYADRQRLQQVLVNLLHNAIKYTDHGRVTLRAAPAAEGLRIEVQDTGIGIAPERHARIFQGFEHFEQHTRDRAGTGLGLVLCYRLVQLLGGRMGLRSEPGQGAVFWLEVPVAADHRGPESAWAAHQLPPDEPLRVLLVDDNPLNLAVARLQLLKVWPRAQVAQAASAAQALRLLDEQAFDVALVDVQMPVMDGPELAQQIRERFPQMTAGMPIIALTAHTDGAERDRCLAAGMQDLLHKPMDEAQLVRTVTAQVCLAREQEAGT